MDDGPMRFPRRAPRLGGPPAIASTTSEPGYPWVDGDLLYSADLNTAIAYSASVYYLTSFGAKTDGITDDSAAFNAAIAAVCTAGGGKVVLPAGRTQLCSSIATNIPVGVTVTIEGMGQGVSELYFSHPTDGLSFMMLNSGNAWGAVNLLSFTVTRGPTSPVMANTGIHLYADPTANKMCGNSMSLRDLTVSGSTPLGNQWLYSMVISGLSSCALEKVFLQGCNATAIDQGDALLTIDGPNSNQYCGGMLITDCTFQGGSAGINVTNYVQGPMIANSFIIGQYDSIRWVSSPSYYAEELGLANCSLNGGHRGVYLSSVNSSSISNCAVLRLIAGTANYAGIEIDNSFLCNVTGNNIIGLNAANETGIIINNCSTGVNTVTGNMVGNMTSGYGIHLMGTTKNAVVVGNGLSSNSIVQDTGGNLILGNSASGSQMALYTNQPMVFQSSGSIARWFVGNDGSTESGGNTGNDFAIVAANDAGSLLGAPIRISRLTGATTFYAYSGDLHTFLSGPAGTNRLLAFQTGTATRWYIGANSDAESGSSTGSDFVIVAATDSGTLGVPLSINRATGIVSLSQHLQITGGFGIWGSAIPAKPTVTGAKAGNAALASLLTALAAYGLVTDSTSA